MADLTAKRTLVKSPPELWSELSEVERLARHLAAFGEIKITKLVPERTVAWEGETASGTVSIEPSGWGTKVTLTAQVEEAAAAAAPVAEAPPVEAPPVEEPPVEEPPVEEPLPEEPPAVAEQQQVKTGLFARLFRRRPKADDAIAEEPLAEEPAPVEEAAPVEEPAAAEPAAEPANGLDGDRAQDILEDALEALGSAHHRPFSRA